MSLRNNEQEADPNLAVVSKTENAEIRSESDEENADQAKDIDENSEKDSDASGEEDAEALSSETPEESNLSDEANNEDKPVTNVEGLL